MGDALWGVREGERKELHLKGEVPVCVLQFSRMCGGAVESGREVGSLPGVPDSKRTKTEADPGGITVLWEASAKVSVDT